MLLRPKSKSPKVAPPRLEGAKVGVFACRSPKRPNDIGITAAKIEGISQEEGELTVSGIDLLDGTPILDIKPYIPQYDSVVCATVPLWISSESHANIRVKFSKEAKQNLNDHNTFSGLFTNAKHIEETIVGVLNTDPRSRLSRKYAEQEYNFTLDGLRVHCMLSQEEDRLSALVTQIQEVQ